ncbi:MAG: hypothetical protein K2Q22_08620, partial [Cytophagales bacterium]|nr:hypothetical protein [Cytophagales bacterium]
MSYLRIVISFVTLTISYTSFAQISSIYVAPFKNDASGAYTLIHDDFGGSWAHGIHEFADSIAFTRGIPFCFAAIGNECDNVDWQMANTLIGHGHQIVN